MVGEIKGAEIEEEFLSVGEVAIKLKCGINTVYNLIENLEIEAFRISGKRGQYRVLKSSYNNYLRNKINAEKERINEKQRR